jgi:hypothetical protein
LEYSDKQVTAGNGEVFRSEELAGTRQMWRKKDVIERLLPGERVLKGPQ